MGKEQCSSYCIFRSSKEGYWRSLTKNIFFFFCKAEAGMATANFQH